ncbi:hypothetical protein N0V88_000695 [Collariella sp. IMI 366227]|nr:hypothetical protein N0V88_000695 [Collariella sp. IMI 366227]
MTAAEPPATIDIDSKFREHLAVPVLDSGRHSKILVPQAHLRAHYIFVDELLRCFSARHEWSRGDTVIANFCVDAIIGKTVILAPHDIKNASGGSTVAREGDKSSANITLVPGADGKLTVRKTAVGNGIDGNGAPRLRQQALFLRASEAVGKTGMFVVPREVDGKGNEVTLVFDYIPSHSFGDLIFANVGAGPAMTAIIKFLARMSTSVWTQGQKPAHPQFIKEAHFGRMERRLGIARTVDKTLDGILEQPSVTLNGRRLRGFDAVIRELSAHPELAVIGPTILMEIHGNLKIHNILGRLDTEQNEPVALINPRGVHLLGDSQGKAIEHGDYAYDVSKLLFSLTGFSEIRKGLFDLVADVGRQSYTLTIRQHPGIDTVDGVAYRLFQELAGDDAMRRWIDKVEPDGVRSFELRARLGEAAHFVAGCACALGRNAPQEVVPLFLTGLEKLNSLSTAEPEPPLDFEAQPESAELGAVMIQQTIFGLHTSSVKTLPYDVLEVSVKAESASVARELFREMAGAYLPEGTPVYLSTEPGNPIAASSSSSHFPCVLIHPSNGARGQTYMVAAATRRTAAFLRDSGLSEQDINELRIIHISSTGASSRSQLTTRSNDKLLSPGSFGISPLKLAVMQANQLPFPRPGRWVVENDSFFLLSRPLIFSGGELCLLVIERLTAGSSSSWKVCVDDVEMDGDRVFAKGFRRIRDDEEGQKLLHTTTGVFVPHRISWEIASREDDYAARTNAFLIDIVLPRFMKRGDWIGLCHEQGYGVDAHLAWRNAERINALAPKVELTGGGPEMAFYQYGSDAEYNELLVRAPDDPRLNSLAYVVPAARWRKRYIEPKLR